MVESSTTPTTPRKRRLFGVASILALVAPLAGAPACGPAPEADAPPTTAPAKTVTPPPPARVEPAAKLSIEPDAAAVARIKADVNYLASPELAGRGTGEPGARKAADYVAARFAELKLAPLGDKSDAGVPAYYQKFEARVGAKVDPPALAAHAGAKKTDADPAAMVTAEGSESGAASGEAVFVGYGITAAAVEWDDYAKADVAGKVVVVLSGAPVIEGKDKRPDALKDFGNVRYKIRTARERKAAAVVLVSASDDLPAAPTDASSMGIPAVVLKKSAAAKLLPAAKLGDKATWEVKKAAPARLLGKTSLSVKTSVNPVTADAWNVVGHLPARAGSKLASEWVVIGAHYDHLGHGGTSSSRAPGAHAIHPGADDNASGTAMLLEAARRFAKLPATPSRNIVFIAFGAEEIGAIGSRYWVEHAPVPMKSVVGMVNADMVGRMRDNKMVLDGTATAASWTDLAKAANNGLGLNLTFGGEGFGASDHASFTAARVPVAFLFTGVHDDYHKPSDTADKLNLEGIERAATLAGRLALAVAERGDRMAFVDAPADPHRSSRGSFRVSLGTVPDYAFTGKGMKLTGVRPDAPAARAGLQAGDVIVKVGAHEITNVHDFMFSLKELEPGREVEVEVERGGARVKLKVVPAPGR